MEKRADESLEDSEASQLFGIIAAIFAVVLTIGNYNISFIINDFYYS